MSTSGSVSGWIERVKAGDSSATANLWNRYRADLLGFARYRLHDEARRVTDEEDLVAATFESFFSRAVAGKFPKLSDRRALWALLLTITDRKVVNTTRRYMTSKRGGGWVRGALEYDEEEDDSEKMLASTDSTQPAPDVAAWLSEMMAALDGDMRQFVYLRMDGYTNEQIAQRLNCSLATVERRLGLLRDQWLKELFK